MDKNSFFNFSFVDDDTIKKEKQRARQLRKTSWWRKKCASGICWYCKRRVGPEMLTMDHVVPLARGGKTTRGNLVPACKECNNRKKNLLPMEWEEYLNSLEDRG